MYVLLDKQSNCYFGRDGLDLVDDIENARVYYTLQDAKHGKMNRGTSIAIKVDLLDRLSPESFGSSYTKDLVWWTYDVRNIVIVECRITALPYV